MTLSGTAYDVRYSAFSNKRTVWNNRAGYYIGHFGYYIKNYFLFNFFFFEKFPKKIKAHVRLLETQEYTSKIPIEIDFSFYWKSFLSFTATIKSHG